MECKHYKEYLHEYVDGTLDPEIMDLIDRHAAQCNSCFKEIEFLKKYDSVMASIPHDKAPDDFLEQVHHRLRESQTVAGKIKKFIEPAKNRITIETVGVFAAAAILFIIFKPSLEINQMPKNADMPTAHETKQPARKPHVSEKHKTEPRRSIRGYENKKISQARDSEKKIRDSASSDDRISEKKLQPSVSKEKKEEVVLFNNLTGRDLKKKALPEQYTQKKYKISVSIDKEKNKLFATLLKKQNAVITSTKKNNNTAYYTIIISSTKYNALVKDLKTLGKTKAPDLTEADTKNRKKIKIQILKQTR